MFSPAHYISCNARHAFQCLLPTKLGCFLNIFNVGGKIKTNQMKKAKATILSC